MNCNGVFAVSVIISLFIPCTSYCGACLPCQHITLIPRLTSDPANEFFG